METRDPRQGYASRTPTAGAPPGWTGWRGRIYAAMLADVSPGPAAQCFVCGPTAFVEPLNDLLVAGGHSPRDVHSERFGPVEDDYGRPAHRRQWDRRRRRRGRRRRDVPVLRTCQSCGDRRAIGEPRPYRSVGELRLYRSVGVVLRCPACEDAGVVLGVHEKRLVVEWRGRYDIAR